VTEPVDTEKGVPDGFFLSDLKCASIFGQGFAPDLSLYAYKSAGLI